MKIAIIGYSASGKSTLAQAMGRRYALPVLHLDRVQFLPGWQVRDKAEQQALTADFLDSHPDGWVIDGNYSGNCYERRMQEADRIIFMNFNRWACLARAIRRAARYRRQTRPDMGEGCTEKLDAEFIWWILYRGRRPQTRARYRRVCRTWPEKVTVLHNQRELDAFMRGLEPIHG